MPRDNEKKFVQIAVAAFSYGEGHERTIERNIYALDESGIVWWLDRDARYGDGVWRRFTNQREKEEKDNG